MTRLGIYRLGNLQLLRIHLDFIRGSNKRERGGVLSKGYRLEAYQLWLILCPYSDGSPGVILPCSLNLDSRNTGAR